MSYLTQSRLATDQQLQIRVAACAAMLGDPNPSAWAGRHAWVLSTQPGWVEAYGAAESAHEAAPDGPLPGEDESAVTDAMILTAVESLRAAQPSSPAL